MATSLYHKCVRFGSGTMRIVDDWNGMTTFDNHDYNHDIMILS